MVSLFSSRTRLGRWLEVELLVVEAWARDGRISHQIADEIRANAPTIDEQFEREVSSREAEVRHDIAAFVDIVAARIGYQARWIHFGITSSDVVDTAMSTILRDAVSIITNEAEELYSSLVNQARAHRETMMIGRTHGVHAQPIYFAHKIALHARQLRRAIDRLELAKAAVSVGSISGVVGTFSHVRTHVEEYVCDQLGLTPQSASQVVARDGRAEFVFALAAIVSVIEAIALQVRLGHQTEVGEIMEGVSSQQKGSSAMPHKANPVAAEQLCGLARLSRSLVSPALENIALWHERDLSHSSVDRVILPDSAMIAHYCIRTARQLVDNWFVDENRMSANLDSSGDLISSEALLLLLVAKGWQRDEAYREVQRCLEHARKANVSLFQQASLLDLELPDSELRHLLDPRQALQRASLDIDDL